MGRRIRPTSVGFGRLPVWCRCPCHTAQGIRMKNPAHPGGFVKSEIVEAMGLTVHCPGRDGTGGHAPGAVRAAQRTGEPLA